jgi:TM2 domain-containing membrane protein YozV
MQNGSGNCGNVIAALASFFIPGLGQLLQGRWLLAGFMFVLTAVLWLVLLGWIIHLWSIVDAAMHGKPAMYEHPNDRSNRYERYNRYDRYSRQSQYRSY